MIVRVLTIALLAGMAATGFAAQPATAPPPSTPVGTAPHPGKVVFDRWCSECHAPGHGHPGTQQLGWTRGENFAVLEQRKDLVADYVKRVVRHGLVEMPPYRPTEISDAELGQLAAYLSRKR